MRRLAILTSVLSGIAGCSIHQTANTRAIQTVRVHSFDESAERAAHSASFVLERAKGIPRLVLWDDGSDAEYFYIALGEDCDALFCRYETLRVARDGGMVERETYDHAGEYLWVPD